MSCDHQLQKDVQFTESKRILGNNYRLITLDSVIYLAIIHVNPANNKNKISNIYFGNTVTAEKISLA